MKQIKPGVCPKCDCKNLNYDCSEIVDNCVKYPYVCEGCGFEGIEWYYLQFVGHNDMDGNELEE